MPALWEVIPFAIVFSCFLGVVPSILVYCKFPVAVKNPNGLLQWIEMGAERNITGDFGIIFPLYSKLPKACEQSCCLKGGVFSVISVSAAFH